MTALPLLATAQTPAAPMIVFTICSRNFLGYAQALWQSLTAHHHNVVFHVGLCDDASTFDILTHPFEIIQISELGIQTWDRMLARYNITELNTALKPFLFLLLFDRYPGQPIVYLDPDILVFSPLTEIFALLDDGANCVLTPHVTGPSEFAEMNDQQFLRYGAYNLGFCVLRGVPEVRRVVSWWGRRLETQCVIDLEQGLFVDQKWADLFPAYIDRTAILRHPGYNVAYWNLAQRIVRVDSAGHWSVNGEPLRFFHFSGNKIEDRQHFSRHSEVFSVETIGDVRKLLDIYRDAVNGNGHPYYLGIPYAFAWSQGDGKHVHAPSSIEAERLANASRIPFLPVDATPPGTEMTERVTSARHQAQRQAVDRLVRRSLASGQAVDGFCVICNAPSQFAMPQTTGTSAPAFAWGPSLACQICEQPSYVRAAAKLLAQRGKDDGLRRVTTNHPGLLLCDGLQTDFDMSTLAHSDRQNPDPQQADIVTLCLDTIGADADAPLSAAYAALRHGGALLLTTGVNLPDIETRLESAGFSALRRLAYWSESLAHFGDAPGAMTAVRRD
ncbi:hypothetical protein ACELLULO517_04045 [Acidisoma cellulosilytica]|uniref:Uncharacterized protein n=1 Tax=Acidisoma cellulosilyticum TaxID=2802395 RepID=A0A964E2M8_9PROT|nr:hypothetical protein [Acidisoma cellulosilyticum]MCB8879392.1 hypothetical protein [Acidisoma cellulosilyticum]